MPVYVVKQGDCLSRIAAQYGFSWETLWDDPANAELKQTRRDPSVLYPGDRVQIPERRDRDESGATAQRHQFRKKAGTARLRLRLLRDGEPRKNRPYKLLVDGVWREGTTDRNGLLDERIPPSAAQAALHVTEGDHIEVYHLGLGSLDPIDTDSGVRQRLANLGYPAKDEAGLEAAVAAFQTSAGLPASGTADDATRAELEQRHGQ